MKDDLCFPDKSHISYEILAYLVDHPKAQDTIDGIMQWWLLERKLKYQESFVRASLDELVLKGYLVRNKGQGDTYKYQINCDKQEEIASQFR